MKKINNRSEIVIGKKYLLKCVNFECNYFNREKVIVKITRLDEDGDFWTNEFEKEDLSDLWEGYEDFCIGGPDENHYDFYEVKK